MLKISMVMDTTQDRIGIVEVTVEVVHHEGKLGPLITWKPI